MFSGVVIVPAEKNVRPVITGSPLSITVGALPLIDWPETVISPINDLFSGVAAKAIIEEVVKITIAKQAEVILRSHSV